MHAGAVAHIKAENGIEYFDMVLIDGSEFTGMREYEQVRGARIILLDDTRTFKCWDVRDRLIADGTYELIAENTSVRNGYAAFRRK